MFRHGGQIKLPNPATAYMRDVACNITETMTFEDFKAHFEIFSKIDTAEKLAICKNQYEKHLLHIEDDKYFEPEDEPAGNGILSQYEQNLKSIFQLDNISENQFYILVRPSFRPEYLLVIEKLKENYHLIHSILESDYWSAFYTDNKISDIGNTTSIAELNKEIGDKIFDLLDCTVIEARKPNVRYHTLDGVKYTVLRIVAGKLNIVSKHSPDENSKSARIIGILELLVDNINLLEEKIILELRTRIDKINER